ncbi:MAG: hypothetical protein OEM28_03680 [Nitrosopumilus sp.]|nr:hypothetical protein [Nitrosopumilus sp.]MDH3487550.1 hypothetical protein [Nitrosopumilus sp.]
MIVSKIIQREELCIHAGPGSGNSEDIKKNYQHMIIIHFYMSFPQSPYWKYSDLKLFNEKCLEYQKTLTHHYDMQVNLSHYNDN